MRFILTTAIVMTLSTGSVIAATPSIDTAKPETVVMMGVKALRNNDVKKFVDALPAASRQQLEADWSAFKVKAKDPKQKVEQAEFDKSLALILSPTAVDDLMKDLEPQLATFDPQEVSQGLMMTGGMLSMMVSQGQAPDAQPDPALAKLGALVQDLSMDISQWVLVAKLNDPATCRKALTQVVAGVKSLGVKDSQAVLGLSFNDVIMRLGPAVKSFKAAALTYGLDADAMLDSVKATTTGSGDTRDLLVDFTAFGKPRQLQWKMVRSNGSWQFDQKALTAPAGKKAMPEKTPSKP